MNALAGVKFEELEQLVRSTYSELWPRLFPGWVFRRRWPFFVCLKPGRLDVRLGDAASGHSESQDRICIYVAEGDLQVVGITEIGDPHDWPMWMTDLVHEMMHEYQQKVRPRPTTDGRRLHADPGNRFDGNGHDVVFYTAIASCAARFEMTPDDFVRCL